MAGSRGIGLSGVGIQLDGANGEGGTCAEPPAASGRATDYTGFKRDLYWRESKRDEDEKEEKENGERDELRRHLLWTTYAGGHVVSQRESAELLALESQVAALEYAALLTPPPLATQRALLTLLPVV